VNETQISGVFAIGVGAFVLSAAFFDWEWFMTHRKAWLITTIFGRTGARIFYGVLGMGFFVFGVGLLVGLFR
jgi:hypothetical protein